jgi:hypothetical protein
MCVVGVPVEAGAVVQFKPRDVVSCATGKDVVVDESSDGQLRVHVGQVEIVDAGWRDAREGLARQFPYDYPTLVEVQPVAVRSILALPSLP